MSFPRPKDAHFSERDSRFGHYLDLLIGWARLWSHHMIETNPRLHRKRLCPPDLVLNFPRVASGCIRYPSLGSTGNGLVGKSFILGSEDLDTLWAVCESYPGLERPTKLPHESPSVPHRLICGGPSWSDISRETHNSLSTRHSPPSRPSGPDPRDLYQKIASHIVCVLTIDKGRTPCHE